MTLLSVPNSSKKGLIVVSEVLALLGRFCVKITGKSIWIAYCYVPNFEKMLGAYCFRLVWSFVRYICSFFMLSGA